MQDGPPFPLVGLLSGRGLDPGALSSAEWAPLVELAVQQGVAPVLYKRLKERGAALPPEASVQLREAYRANAARNMRLLHERDRILAALGAGHVSAVVIKGASLAEALYGDAALRPMADVDLWLQRPDIPTARAAMEKLGYAARSKPDRPSALQEALAGETQMFKGKDLLVELHWKIFSGEWLRHTARVDEQAIWERSTPADGGAARQLSPEDAVVHLCVHLAVNHQMSGIGLRTLMDLDYARHTWAIDWTIVAQRAREWRVACATWLVLNALAELFGDPRRELPLRDLAPSSRRQSALARFANPRLLAEGLELSGGPRRFGYLLTLVDRPADAAVLAWRGLFPDRLWLTLRYEAPEAGFWKAGALRLRHLLSFARTGEV